MKAVVYLFIIFLSCFFPTAQAQDTDAKQIARDLHSKLGVGNYEEAYHAANLLRRKVSGNLILGSCLYCEYARLCIENSLPCGDEELKQFLDMYKYAYIATPQKYIKKLDKLSNYFYNHQDYHSAVIVFDTLIDNSGILSPQELVNYLCGKGWAYNYSKEPYKAYLSFARSADYAKEQFGEISEQYAESLLGLAYECQYLHKEALPLYHQLTDIYKSLYGEESKMLAINYDNIAGRYHKGFHKLDSALAYYQKAHHILEMNGDTSMDMVINLNNIGTCYSEMGDIKNAMKCYMEALSYGQASNLMCNIAYLYKKQGQVDKAFEYLNQMDSFYRDNIYAALVARCYADYKQESQFVNYYKKYLDYIKTVCHNNFIQMVSSERQSYLFKGYDCAFDSLFVIAEQTQNKNAAKVCYDYLLSTKSLSLSFDRHIEDIVHSSGNPDLIAEYNEVLRLTNLAKYDKSILITAQNAEETFLQHLQNVTDYTALLDLTSSDISRVLKKQDVVIEFYNADEHDNNNLYALILIPTDEVNIIKIGVSDKLSESDIWRVLHDLIKPYKNIYFVADGIVNSLPLESAVINGKFISENYNIYRLSSSRELALKRKNKNTSNDYVLYGGLDYSCDLSKMNAENSKSPTSADDYEIKNSLLSKLRGASVGIQQLPGTLTEVRNIGNMIKQKLKTASVTVFTGDMGTETSVKQLSGKNLHVLHIATHGFYYDDSQSVSSLDSDNQHYADNEEEDKLLTRSGLYMAGAEHYLYDTVDEYNDGILTAIEVSTIDMRGVDLVTLSACDTALGESSSDGVFGLQRGFKKAGANSILMSLWTVDDEATCKLMTEFYSNWIGKKMTKHAALEAAKKTVRETMGWEDSRYWAAFILLDGLD